MLDGAEVDRVGPAGVEHHGLVAQAHAAHAGGHLHARAVVVEGVAVVVGAQRRADRDVLAVRDVGGARRMHLQHVDQRRGRRDAEFDVETDFDEHGGAGPVGRSRGAQCASTFGAERARPSYRPRAAGGRRTGTAKRRRQPTKPSARSYRGLLAAPTPPSARPLRGLGRPDPKLGFRLQPACSACRTDPSHTMTWSETWSFPHCSARSVVPGSTISCSGSSLAVAGIVGLVAVVNALDMFFDAEAG